MGKIDSIAGTSTRGIIALGLAAGMTPDALASLYRERSKDIFDRTCWESLTNPDNAIWAKYSNEKLKQILVEKFETDCKVATLHDQAELV